MRPRRPERSEWFVKTRVTTVVFDIGNVLVDWNPRYLYRKLFDDAEAMERFLGEICTSDWNLELDRGRPFAEAVAERIALYPDFADLIRAYDARWSEMIAGPIAGTVASAGAARRARDAALCAHQFLG